jgi:predicted RNA binding protein YcfA (HicA-like mRNA interferase family)
MSGSLPSFKLVEVIRILERNGFHRTTKRKKHRIYTN